MRVSPPELGSSLLLESTEEWHRAPRAKRRLWRARGRSVAAAERFPRNIPKHRAHLVALARLVSATNVLGEEAGLPAPAARPATLWTLGTPVLKPPAATVTLYNLTQSDRHQQANNWIMPLYRCCRWPAGQGVWIRVFSHQSASRFWGVLRIGRLWIMVRAGRDLRARQALGPPSRGGVRIVDAGSDGRKWT